MIAVLGGFGVGLTMRIDRAPSAGETVSGGILSAGPGGKGSNQAIGISRLGHPATLLTAVGPDAAAADARALWAAESVDARAVVTGSSATMTGFILVDSAGENRIAIAPGALDELTIEHVDSFRDTIAAADLLVVSLEIPREVAIAALEAAREAGTRSVLNPAPAAGLGARPRIADVLTPNSSEGRALLGVGAPDYIDDEALARRLADRLECDIVLTLGSRGAVVVDAGRTHCVPARQPRAIVDTTGAGDAFTAALAVALVEGAGLADAAHWAAEAGAHAVSMAEVIPALPHRSDLGPLTRTTERETE
ncbi:ribokinase [Schumannella luteola]